MKKIITLIVLFLSLNLTAQETNVLVMSRQRVYIDDEDAEYAAYDVTTGILQANGGTFFLTEFCQASTGEAVLRLLYDSSWIYDTYEGVDLLDSSLYLKTLSVKGTGNNENVSINVNYIWDMDTQEEDFELLYQDAAGTTYSFLGFVGRANFSQPWMN